MARSRIKIKYPDVDLRKEMHDCGEALKAKMKQRMRQGMGMDQAPAKPKASGKGTRMIRTGAFLANAINFRASKLGLRIYVKNTRHPSSESATYEDIGAWNQKGHDDQSKRIPNASRHFGITKFDEDYWLEKLLKSGIKQIDKKLSFSGQIRIDM